MKSPHPKTEMLLNRSRTIGIVGAIAGLPPRAFDLRPLRPVWQGVLEGGYIADVDLRLHGVTPGAATSVIPAGLEAYPENVAGWARNPSIAYSPGVGGRSAAAVLALDDPAHFGWAVADSLSPATWTLQSASTMGTPNPAAPRLGTNIYADGGQLLPGPSGFVLAVFKATEFGSGRTRAAISVSTDGGRSFGTSQRIDDDDAATVLFLHATMLDETYGWLAYAAAASTGAREADGLKVRKFRVDSTGVLSFITPAIRVPGVTGRVAWPQIATYTDSSSGEVVLVAYSDRGYALNIDAAPETVTYSVVVYTSGTGWLGPRAARVVSSHPGVRPGTYEAYDERGPYGRRGMTIANPCRPALVAAPELRGALLATTFSYVTDGGSPATMIELSYPLNLLGRHPTLPQIWKPLTVVGGGDFPYWTLMPAVARDPVDGTIVLAYYQCLPGSDAAVAVNALVLRRDPVRSSYGPGESAPMLGYRATGAQLQRDFFPAGQSSPPEPAYRGGLPVPYALGDAPSVVSLAAPAGSRDPTSPARFLVAWTRNGRIWIRRPGDPDFYPPQVAVATLHALPLSPY